MNFVLPRLPYAIDALEPHISAKTLEFHHGKHHKAYLDKLNSLLEQMPLREAKTLEDIIRASAGDASKTAIFNNAAQTWNHTFFWNSMRPQGGGQPTGAIAEMITWQFGGYEKFAEKFLAEAVNRFGSGWVWLTVKDGQLRLTSTPNAGVPFVEGDIPLLTLDVWEHAYYLDYQNRRPDFVETFLEKLVNWEFANENAKKAKLG